MDARAYDRETVWYKGPVTGRMWQLQGQGQEKQPVTLLRSPAGLFGTGLKIHRRELPRSRRSVRTSVRPQPLNMEMVFDIKERTPHQTARTLEQFLLDWPDDGQPGTLGVHSRTGKCRYLDVYRTDRVEDLIGIAPMAVGKAKIMIVFSSDDPYPYGDYIPDRHPLSANLTEQIKFHNTGQVRAGAQLHWQGGATTLQVTGAAKFNIKLTGNSLIDLDEEELTVTDAQGTRPIHTSWDQSPACMVLPGRTATINVRANAPGQLDSHVVPQFWRLYA